MNRVLLRFLYRRHRLTTALVGAAPVFVGLIIGLVYPTYAKERELARVFEHTLRFFGHDVLDMFSPAGSFSLVFQDPLILLCYALLPALAPLALFAGDRARGALDLVLATPLDRGTMGRTVALFQALQALWFAVLAYLSALLAALVAGEWAAISALDFLPLLVVAFGVTLAFGGLASLIAVASSGRGRAGVVYGSIVFVFMALEVLARMWRAGAVIGWLTPLGYLRPANLLAGEASPAARLAYFLVPPAAAVLLWALAIRNHRRRSTA